MADQPQRITGLAYVPGHACGELRTGSTTNSPDDILVINQDQVGEVTAAAGIIVLDGAPLSHHMIRLLGLGIPTVSLDARHAPSLRPGSTVMLDGAEGVVIIDPAEPSASPGAPPPPAGQPVFTADGVPVQLLASVRDTGAAHRAVSAGATAIGLVRSEFCEPPDGSRPDTSFYQQTFRSLCEAAAPLPVTIRLLDASPDKRPAWLPAIEGFGSPLGLHGSRLFSNKAVRDVVDAQLQGISALAGDFPLRVIIPYLTRHEELAYWVERIRAALPPSTSIGAMVETPASALDIGDWFDTADFIAVGCNDLMQGLFSADRDSPELSAFLDPYAPLLYRLLRQMAEAAGEHLHRIQLCGVLPQLQSVLPVLLGLGYRTFSVDPAHIPYLARDLGGLQLVQAQQLAERICRCRLSSEVLALLGLPQEHHRPFTG